MTPPDTNIEKQTRRHIWPLIGIALAALIGGGVTFYWIGEEVVTAPPTVIEGEESARNPAATDSETEDSAAPPTDAGPAIVDPPPLGPATGQPAAPTNP